MTTRSMPQSPIPTGRAFKGRPMRPIDISCASTVALSRSRSTQRRKQSIRSSPTFLWRRLESRCPRSRSCSTEWRAASTLVAKQSSETAIGRISGLVRHPLEEPDGVGVEVDALGAAEPGAVAVRDRTADRVQHIPGRQDWPIDPWGRNEKYLGRAVGVGDVDDRVAAKVLADEGHR